MAPKVPDNLKSHKKPEEPGKAAEKGAQGTKALWEDVKQKLASPRIQQATIWMSGLLFIVAVMLIGLYVFKLNNITEKYRAATKIHRFMQNYNETFKGKNPSQTLRAINDEWRRLKDLYDKNNELRKSINEIMTRIAEGWIPFGGHLYFFQSREVALFSAKHLCNEIQTDLVEIHSDAEQNFLAQQVYRIQKGCWIGLEKQDNVWRWKTGGTPKKFYWSPGHPWFLDEPRDICVLMRVCPEAERPNCWNAMKCGGNYPSFCMLKADTQWL
ncbi:ladderlectin-like isoform X2 [Paroedura picta]|uniref:ladderlectin-like isoform X2 n=1 Tax=Paroedura picta TaxID=143630 RepID=UPI0040567DBB